MRILLLQDYRGVLTKEVYYLAGEHDLELSVAQALIDDGRAELLEEPEKPAPKRGKK